MDLPLTPFVPTSSLNDPPNGIPAPFGPAKLLTHPYEHDPAVGLDPAVLPRATGSLGSAVITAPTIPNVELKHRLP